MAHPDLQFGGEEALGKVYDSRILKRVSRYARPYLPHLALAVLLAGLLSASEVLLPYLTKVGIDRYIIFSGRIVDLELVPAARRQVMATRYEEDSVRLADGRLVIREGLLDPADRHVLDETGALTAGAYYLLELDRYPAEARERLRGLAAEQGVMTTDQPGLLCISGERLELLPADVRDGIRGPDRRGLATIAMVYLGILVVSFGLTFGQVYLMTWIGQYVMYDIRTDLFNHVQSLPIRFFNQQPTGRLVTRVSNDVNTLQELFTSILVDMFKNVLKLIGIVIAMLLLAPHLAYATFSLLPLIIVVTWVFKKKMRDAYRWVRVTIAKINAMLAEHLGGIKLIKAFAREAIHFDKFRVVNHEAYRANMYQLIVQSMFSPFIVLLENLGVGLILYYGGGQVVRNTISLGTLVAFLSYLSMFFAPIRDIAEKVNIMQSAMAASERILQLLAQPSELADEQALDAGRMERFDGGLEFEGVWFAYEPDEWVLKDVSFRVEPGETVAIVGATGSGKTTIISLLSRFFAAQKGAIRMDGHDITSIPRRELRRRMAVVLQDVFLFAGDIRRNIRLNESSITDEDIERVARLVHADRFIERLPGGYGAVLEEGGTTLSMGQRQLLAFARALAFDPAVLVLDEATANIDSETERWIQNALETLLECRTSVVIAHRLSTIKKADKIIVMHKGRIMEIGNHQSLLDKRGFYHKLYMLQFKSQELPVSPSATRRQQCTES
ncbi:ABC transporter ATP-binding protein [bacterium]|nr:ABC transporter ATP-binding protein [candidate division CSSED10-310 bacterium]